MASKRYRPTASGEPRWAILYRDGAKQTSQSFTDEAKADRFKNLLELLGLQAALDDIGKVANDRPTVEEYVNTHINNLSGITEGTRSDYRSYARRDLGAIGGLPVDLLTREAVSKWVNDLSTRLSGKSIKNRHSLLSGALTRAQRDGLITDNPAKGVRLPRSIRRDMVFLTQNEFTRLLSHVPAYWQPLVVTLAGTAMRWGEATALEVQDVDLDSDTTVIRVRQAYKHTDGKGRELGPPKTRKGRRTVEIGPEIVAALRPLVKDKATTDKVFLNRHGRPVSQSTFLVHVWQPAVRDFAGDTKVDGKWKPGPGKRPRVHDLRHTHISWLIAANVPLTYIQERVGHNSIQTTSDVYGHLAPDAGKVSAEVTSLALAQAFPTVESPPAIGGRSPQPE